MSGHSKWSTIKRKKAATDSKRGQLFTKLLREIQVAAKIGGGNIDGNSRLKAAVVAARAMSVPGDNIERAIKRGSGDLDGVSYEEITYEGYGPEGTAIIVKALTDNRVRTVADLRYAFSRHSGNLAATNSVAYLFHETGVVELPINAAAEEKILELALEAGAEDLVNEETHWEVRCAAVDLEQVKSALEVLSKDLIAEIRLIPSTKVSLSGENAQSLLKLLAALEELDDVQSVVANFEIEQAELEKFAG